MSPAETEIYNIVRQALEEGVSLDWQPLLIFGLLVLIAVLARSLVSYSQTKGMNLATKEDIKEITEKVESVRIEYAKQLELFKQAHTILLQQQDHKHQLRLAALDKRLKVHQKAYTLWREMRANMTSEEKIGEIVDRCHRFFIEKSLYLTKEARQAFSDAYIEAIVHPRLHTEPSISIHMIKESVDIIDRAGKIIVEAVSLPSLGEAEYKPIEELKKNNGE